jgi:hypothetical protein
VPRRLTTILPFLGLLAVACSDDTLAGRASTCSVSRLAGDAPGLSLARSEFPQALPAWRRREAGAGAMAMATRPDAGSRLLIDVQPYPGARALAVGADLIVRGVEWAGGRTQAVRYADDCPVYGHWPREIKGLRVARELLWASEHEHSHSQESISGASQHSPRDQNRVSYTRIHRVPYRCECDDDL